MGSRGILFVSWILLCVMTLTVVSFSQSDTATIAGRVVDPTGLVIKGAGVNLVDVDHDSRSTSKTNSAGLYVFSNIKPGHYRIEVSAPGFRAVNLTGLTLNVQDSVEENFKLMLGSVSESVTVQANSTQLELTTAVSTNVDQHFVSELPLNGRSFQTLFQLTPGVVIASTSATEQGQFNINGQRANSNYFMVDGVSANVGATAGILPGQSLAGSLPALAQTGGTNSLVSVDALQEFTIQTSSYAAEFGRTPGGQISIITRSGNNELHGSAFDYFRNDVLDANDWFANNHNLERAPLRQNDFGGVVGGPIMKDRTFFFASYEGLRLRQPTTALTEVPSAAARLAAPAAIRPFVDAFPLPTGPDEGNGLAPADYAFSNPTRLDAASIRLDHTINTRLSVFARYNRSTTETAGRGAFHSLSSVLHRASKLHTITSGLTWAINPAMADDFHFNWSWSGASLFTAFDPLGGAQPLDLQGVLPANETPATTQFILSIDSGNTSSLVFGPNSHNVQRQLNFVDNLSWHAGNHMLKIGFDYRRLTPQVNQSSYGQEADFGSVDDLLAGNPTDGVQISSHFAPVDLTYSNYSAFAQDTWKTTTRLTLTYGLRWDYNPAPSGHGPNGLPVLTVVGINDLAHITPAPAGTPLYHATLDNFAPRVGVAYNVIDSSNYAALVRAGFGLFFDLGNGQTGNVATGFPFSNVAFRNPTTFPLSPADAAPLPPSLDPPFGSMNAYPSTLRQPYTYHWNLSWQQLMGSSQVLSIGYVGAAGHSLVRQDVIQGPLLNPDFSSIAYTSNLAHSNYNAMQIDFRRRQTKRLDILAAYTWAHSLDNVSNESGTATTGLVSTNINPAIDYGNSDFDIRHTGSLALDYQLPTLGRSRWTEAIFSGWGVNTLLNARSAPPLTVTVLRNLGLGFQPYRPDVVPGIAQYLGNPAAPGGRMLNAAAFSPPSAPIQGNLGRNSLRGFPLFQEDFSLRRDFGVNERVHLVARFEAFNLFNHPNFASPARTLGFVVGGNFVPFSSFGVSQSMLAGGLGSTGSGAGFNPLYQAGGPRSLQLALKLQF